MKKEFVKRSFQLCFILAVLLAVTFTGCQMETSGYQNEETVYPLPKDHPDAIPAEDLSLIEPLEVPVNVSTEVLTGDKAVDDFMEYDLLTGTITDIDDSALASRNTTGLDYINPYIPEHAQPDREIWGSGRSRITNTTVYPNCTFAKVIITFQSGVVKAGSGTMVGYKHLLTAGHCVRHPTYGWAQSMQIIPGYSNGYTPYGSSWGIHADYPDQWGNDMNVNYDYALIELNSEIGRNCGWHGYAWMGDYYISRCGMKMYGYPAELDNQEYQYVSFDSVRTYSSTCIFYWADSSGGQSGGPVISTSNYFVSYLIAVHSGSNSSYNRGSRITSGRFNWINNLKNAHGDY